MLVFLAVSFSLFLVTFALGLASLVWLASEAEINDRQNN